MFISLDPNASKVKVYFVNIKFSITMYNTYNLKDECAVPNFFILPFRPTATSFEKCCIYENDWQKISLACNFLTFTMEALL